MSRRGGLGAAGLTPLLDTLFLLIFALLAIAQTRTTGRNDTVRIELPEVEPGSTALSADDVFVRIHVDAQGAVRVEGQELPLSALTDLDPALSSILGDTVPESVRVEIVADDAAPYGVAVTLLQHLRLAGFTRVGLLASKEAEPTLPGPGTAR